MVFPGLIAIVLAALLAVSRGVEAAETVTLTTGDWPPYCSETYPHYGVANQIVTEAFGVVGVDVDYGFFPWPRAMKLAREGDWDGTTIWFDTEDRRASFHYSDPIVIATNSLFYLKGSEFEWSGYDDLAGLTVGGTVEYSYGTMFDRAEAAGIFTTHRSRTDEAGLENLLKGRIDVFPGELMVTLETMRESLAPEDAARITYHLRPISIQPLYLLMSRAVDGNDALLQRFNEGLAQLRENGRYDEIVENAFGGYIGGHGTTGD